MQQNSSNAYRNISLSTEMMSASPHRLIQILFEETIRQIALAKQALVAKNLAGQYKYISGALTVILALKASVNRDIEGEISKNLFDLYEYMEWHLVDANRLNSLKHLEEVETVIRTIKDGWDNMNSQDNSPTGS